ncbi:DUF1259 domain-containing protein [Streptomyces sp. NPDC056909]|uniref:DUF1259 domain-containing protein n=1 Tax=Streptomyces sp. NPDC056909 TaxID=3345963 RepID=UPI00368AA600
MSGDAEHETRTADTRTDETGADRPAADGTGTDGTDAPDPAAAAAPRRRLLVAAALAPVFAGMGTMVALAEPAKADVTEVRGAKEAKEGLEGGGGPAHLTPVPTTTGHWKEVADVLGRPGSLVRGLFYHTRFARDDLKVISYGVEVAPELALGSHMAFVRYSDDSVLVMGDLNVTEDELQKVIDALADHGIAVTALHKHLLAHSPDVWWTHIHGHGDDPVPLARGLRAAMDRTSSPPARPTGRPPRLDLDIEAIEAVMGVKGENDRGIYKSVFARREPIIDGHMVLPPGLGATSAFNFQPLGGGRAALNGDFAMVADEVQDVLTTLRRGGISLVEVHNHGLTEEPRLFFTHLWAVDDAVKIAEALRPAVDLTNVVPVSPERDYV